MFPRSTSSKPASWRATSSALSSFKATSPRPIPPRRVLGRLGKIQLLKFLASHSIPKYSSDSVRKSIPTDLMLKSYQLAQFSVKWGDRSSSSSGAKSLISPPSFRMAHCKLQLLAKHAYIHAHVNISIVSFLKRGPLNRECPFNRGSPFNRECPFIGECPFNRESPFNRECPFIGECPLVRECPSVYQPS